MTGSTTGGGRPMAPPRTPTADADSGRPPPVRPAPWPRLETDGAVERADLLLAELALLARLEVAQRQGSEVGAHQAGDRVTDLGQHPADDVLAALVQGDLDEDPGADRVDQPEAVDLGRPVLELHAGLEGAPDVAADRAGDLGEVG